MPKISAKFQRGHPNGGPNRFDTGNHISGTTEVTVAKFYVHVEYIKCLDFDDRLLMGLMGLVRVT